MRAFSLLIALLAATTAFADVQYDQAPVVDVENIVERVKIKEPKERCWFEQARVRVEESNTRAPLLGAVIGGAIGNAVGHNKRNKQVGAVVGAVLGGSIAHDLSRRNTHRNPVRRVRQEVCEVVETTKYRERISGYLVTYRYGGRLHRSRMATRPGETVSVRIQVSAVEAPPETHEIASNDL